MANLLVKLNGNPNLRTTVKVARKVGIHVEIRKGTGEFKFTHPSWDRLILVNSRRKDTPRTLLVLVRKVVSP